jgi:hypothetical protein
MQLQATDHVVVSTQGCDQRTCTIEWMCGVAGMRTGSNKHSGKRHVLVCSNKWRDAGGMEAPQEGIGGGMQ